MDANTGEDNCFKRSGCGCGDHTLSAAAAAASGTGTKKSHPDDSKKRSRNLCEEVVPIKGNGLVFQVIGDGRFRAGEWALRWAGGIMNGWQEMMTR